MIPKHSANYVCVMKALALPDNHREIKQVAVRSHFFQTNTGNLNYRKKRVSSVPLVSGH